MRRLTAAAMIAALALLLPSAALAAPRPPALGVTFDVLTYFEVPDNAFTAAGPAVDAGFVCAEGVVNDLAGKLVQNRGGMNIIVVKEFTCGDGSGTFVVKLTVRLDQRGDNFSWTVMSGTDAYATLHGSGMGFGLPLEGGVEDVYQGLVRRG